MGHVAHTGEKRNVYRVLVRKPNGKIPFGRPSCRWKVTTKLDLKEVGLEGMNWIHLTEDRGKCVNAN